MNVYKIILYRTLFGKGLSEGEVGHGHFLVGTDRRDAGELLRLRRRSAMERHSARIELAAKPRPEAQ